MTEAAAARPSGAVQSKLATLSASIAASGSQFKEEIDQQAIAMEARLAVIRDQISDIDVEIRKQTQQRCLVLGQEEKALEDKVAELSQLRDQLMQQIDTAITASVEKITDRIKAINSTVLQEQEAQLVAFQAFYDESRQKIDAILVKVDENSKNYSVISQYKDEFIQQCKQLTHQLQIQHQQQLLTTKQFQDSIITNFEAKRSELAQIGDMIKDVIQQTDAEIAANTKEREENYQYIVNNMEVILSQLSDVLGISKNCLGIV